MEVIVVVIVVVVVVIHVIHVNVVGLIIHVFILVSVKSTWKVSIYAITKLSATTTDTVVAGLGRRGRWG